MKALVLEERGVDGVKYKEVDKPTVGDTDVLVRMLAASLNRVDVYMRDSGAGITHTLPQIMGIEGVGEVVQAPAGSRLKAGQRVILYPYTFCGKCPFCLAGDQPLCESGKLLGEHRDGTLAEYVALPEISVLPISESVDPSDAATIGVAYLTAWRMIFGKTPLQSGQTVLIQGAGGGVSFAAAQLAKMAGARVLVTTTGQDKIKLCQDAGFETFDYKADPLKAILAATEGLGADLVIDNVGDATWPLSMRATRRGGHIVTCGATTGSHPSADLQRLFIRQISVHGSTLGSLTEFRNLLNCFENGLLKAEIDSTYDLSDGIAALERLEAPERIGKVVIKIAEPSSSSAARASGDT